MKNLKIKLFRDVKLPTRAHATDAGLDLYLPNDFKHEIGKTKIALGIGIELQKGYMAQVIERSSVAAKGYIFAKSPIDSGYNGEIHLICDRVLLDYHAGDKIAQLVITKIKTPTIKVVQDFKKTERGTNGFGSTGK